VSIDTKRVTHPLFVIVKPRKRDSDQEGSFVAKAADLIVDTWRFGGVPFVELYDEPDASDKDWWTFDHPIVLLHRYLRSRQVKAIPVTATDRKGEYRDAVCAIVKELGNGLAVRLYENDLELPAETVATLGNIAADSGCSKTDIDILIDLKRIHFQRLPELRPRVLDFLTALDANAPYRSVTLAGSSVPLNLDGIPELQDRNVPRLEWRLWRDVRVARGRRGAPSFGDYRTVRPEYDDRSKGFKHINAKIFYTTDEFLRVVRGQSRMKEKLELQYPQLARRLVASGAAKSAAFSWGDAQIAMCARWSEGFGMPVKWIAITTSHHVEFVRVQLAQEFVHQT
jgi:hypothetical protein